MVPRLAGAQSQGAPIIGFLHNARFEARREILVGFHRGLADTGFVEGRNCAVEYRWAEDHNERLPVLAAELVARGVAVFVAGSTASALAAKAATQVIPIVFPIASDPIEVKLVASLARPAGNLTGLTVLLVETTAKRFELLHELVPAAQSIAFLVNPTNPVLAEADIAEARRATRVLGVNLALFEASNAAEINAAFATMASRRIGALVTNTDNLFVSERDRLAKLAAEYGVPAIYAYRENTAAGGLMSYGGDNVHSWRGVGVYAGRILRGDKPADLPVQQETRIELIINMKAAKALGFTFPLTLLGRADEVIE